MSISQNVYGNRGTTLDETGATTLPGHVYLLYMLYMPPQGNPATARTYASMFPYDG